MSKLRLFTYSFVLTAGALLILAYLTRAPQPEPRWPKLTPIAENTFITSQLLPENLPALKRRGIAALVDIRPDGEEKGQPSSAEIAAAAKSNSIEFHYIPVPHESIPEAAVETLSAVLDRKDAPAVLYCRSGRRAARLFALAEARRPGGLAADEIVRNVSDAGFSAEDLRTRIGEAVSARAKSQIPSP